MTRREKPLLKENRKTREDEAPPVDDARALGVVSLIAQVQTMIEESGDPAGFNAVKWVARWLDRPLPALEGQKPSELKDTPEGRALVHNMVARMQSGAYS